MWLIYTVLFSALFTVVNYIDEYLTIHTPVPIHENPHVRIGGLLLISSLLSGVGAFIVWLLVASIAVPIPSLMLALGSGVFMVTTFGFYFYLINHFDAYRVVPFFVFAAFWLLLFEYIFGALVTTYGVIGIVLLVAGAYLLDTGTFRWVIPGRLALYGTGMAAIMALQLLFLRLAAAEAPEAVVYFWQLVGAAALGILLFTFVRAYRRGLMLRLKNRSTTFLGFTVLNETLSQIAFYLTVLAIAAAPLAAFVSALSGVQSLMFLALTALFPIRARITIRIAHVVGILLLAVGVAVIELF